MRDSKYNIINGILLIVLDTSAIIHRPWMHTECEW